MSALHDTKHVALDATNVANAAAIAALQSKPYFIANRNGGTSQTWTATTSTAMIMDSEDYDAGGLHNTGTGVITGLAAGVWHFDVTLNVTTPAAAGAILCDIKKNGGTFVYRGDQDNNQPVAGNTHAVGFHGLVLVSSTADTWEVYCQATMAGTKTLNTNLSQWSGFKVA